MTGISTLYTVCTCSVIYCCALVDGALLNKCAWVDVACVLISIWKHKIFFLNIFVGHFPVCFMYLSSVYFAVEMRTLLIFNQHYERRRKIRHFWQQPSCAHFCCSSNNNTYTQYIIICCKKSIDLRPVIRLSAFE